MSDSGDYPQPMATRFEFLPPRMFEGAPRDTAHLHDSFAITVSWRGGGTWAISRGHGWSSEQVWCRDSQEWEYEPSPSNRDDAFLARTRYSKDEALSIAAALVEARVSGSEGTPR